MKKYPFFTFLNFLFFRDILQKHLKEKVEPHLTKRLEEYHEIDSPKPVNMTDEEWEEHKFENKQNFLYDKVEALNIHLTTRKLFKRENKSTKKLI
jgi:hypothetical protein